VTLQITAHFTGLRYLIFHFPVISACVGTAINFFVLVVITLLLWYHYDYEMEWVEEARKSFSINSKVKKTKSKSRLDSTEKFFDDALDKINLGGDDLLFYGDSDDQLKDQEE
jgi:Putative adipose-regulatory protein (Seipin)